MRLDASENKALAHLERENFGADGELRDAVQDVDKLLARMAARLARAENLDHGGEKPPLGEPGLQNEQRDARPGGHKPGSLFGGERAIHAAERPCPKSVRSNQRSSAWR